MRCIFCGIMIGAGLASALAAQTTAGGSPPANTTAAAPAATTYVMPTPLLKQLQDSMPPPAPPKDEPTAKLEAYLFLGQNILINPTTQLPKDSRTPAQLEALLGNYVGTWRGQSHWYSTATGYHLDADTEMAYTLVQENGHPVLKCRITYALPAGPSVILSRTWVENGHLFSESAQADRSQKFVGITNANGVTWSIYGEADQALDFNEVETLRLTPTGGEILQQGYQMQHYARGQALVAATAELKLVK